MESETNLTEVKKNNSSKKNNLTYPKNSKTISSVKKQRSSSTRRFSSQRKRWLLWKNIIKTGVGGKTEILALIIFALLMSLVIISSTGISHYMSSQDKMIKKKGNVADADISFNTEHMTNTSDTDYEVRNNVGAYNINDSNIYLKSTTNNYPYSIAKYFGLADEAGNYIHNVATGTNDATSDTRIKQFLYYLRILWNKGQLQNNSNYSDYIPTAFLSQVKDVKGQTIRQQLFSYLNGDNTLKQMLTYINKHPPLKIEMLRIDFRNTSMHSSLKLIGTLINLAVNNKVHIAIMPYKERNFFNQIKNKSTNQQQIKVIGVPSYFNTLNSNHTKTTDDYLSFQNASADGPIMSSSSAIFCSQNNYLSSSDFLKHGGTTIPLTQTQPGTAPIVANLNILRNLGLLSTDKKLHTFAKPNNNNPNTDQVPTKEEQKSYYLSNSEDYNHKHWNALINAVGTYLGYPGLKPPITMKGQFSRSQIPNVLAILKNGKLSLPLKSANGLNQIVADFATGKHKSDDKQHFDSRNLQGLFREINKPVIVDGSMPRFSREVAVNPAFLIKNHKKVWKGNLSKVLKGGPDDFSKNLALINDKYKITIRGVPLLISGEATTPEYMYAQFNPLNLSPNNKNQAIIFTYNMYFTDSLGSSIFQTTSESGSQSTNGLFLKVTKGTSDNKARFLQNVKGLNSFIFNKIAPASTDAAFIGTKVNLYNDPSYIFYSRTKFLNRLLKGINIITWICISIVLCDCILVILLIIRFAMYRDRKKIGILRALGYKNVDVNLPYIFYPMICGLTGIAISVVLFSIFTYVSVHFLLGYFNIALKSASFTSVIKAVVSTNYTWTIFGILFPIFLITAIALILAGFLMRKPVINLIVE